MNTLSTCARAPCTHGRHSWVSGFVPSSVSIPTKPFHASSLEHQFPKSPLVEMFWVAMAPTRNNLAIPYEDSCQRSEQWLRHLKSCQITEMRDSVRLKHIIDLDEESRVRIQPLCYLALTNTTHQSRKGEGMVWSWRLQVSKHDLPYCEPDGQSHAAAKLGVTSANDFTRL